MKNLKIKINSSFLRFIQVGLMSNIVNIVIYIFLYKILNIQLFISSIIGYIFGLVISFHFGRTWVFDNYNEANLRNVFLFLLVYLIGGLGMACIITFLTKSFNINYIISWFFGAIYAVPNNYLGLKIYVFGKK